MQLSWDSGKFSWEIALMKKNPEAFSDAFSGTSVHQKTPHCENFWGPSMRVEQCFVACDLCFI